MTGSMTLGDVETKKDRLGHLPHVQRVVPPAVLKDARGASKREAVARWYSGKDQIGNLPGGLRRRRQKDTQ